MAKSKQTDPTDLPTKMVEHKTIGKAMLAIETEVQGIIKDATASPNAGGYGYSSQLAVTARLRSVYIKNGVLRRRVKVVPHGRFGNGVGIDMVVTYRYYLANNTTEEIVGVNCIDTEVLASGMVGKSGDKSTFAAQTTGGKYNDLDTLYLPAFDDVESFEEITGRHATEVDDEEEEEAPRKPVSKSRGKAKPKPEPEEEEEEGEEEEEETPKKSLKRGKKKPLPKPDPDEEEEEEDDDDPDAEEEEEEDDDDAEEIDLDEVDFEDEDTVEEIMGSLDLSDIPHLKEIITSFTDANQLAAFYSALLKYVDGIKNGKKIQKTFTEKLFPIVEKHHDSLD